MDGRTTIGGRKTKSHWTGNVEKTKHREKRKSMIAYVLKRYGTQRERAPERELQRESSREREREL